MDKYGVAVIGGGPGGYVAAIRASQLGKKTVLFENRELGGTCLNRGCIPLKALLNSAEVYELAVHADQFGVIAENVSFDYDKFFKRKEAVVSRLRAGVVSLLKNYGVEVIRESAALVGGNTVIAGGIEYKAESIILATGSYPSSLPVPGAGSALNSDGVLDLKNCPESVIIIGGGVIGCEFATLFTLLKKKVTIIEMLPSILPEMDLDLGAAAHKLLLRKGAEIHTGAKVLSVEGGKSCVFEKDGKTLKVCGDAVILAVGRKPNTASLGLETAGIKTNRDYIEVDDFIRTNVPNIYAVGDITGKMQLAHLASAQGIAAAQNACGIPTKLDYRIIPSCVYTNPEIASVGLTDAQAKESGFDTAIGSFPVISNGRSMTMGVRDGFAKIVSDKNTGEILGCQIFSPRATDMIAEIAAAMKAKMTVKELADTVHPHPTVSEIIMEAAHDALGHCVHKYK